MSNETDAKVAEYLQSIGVTYAAKYAGETTRDNGKWQCDAWRVIFTRAGKPAIETDYFTGLGHRKTPRKAAPSWMTAKPIAPASASVLYSLLMDGAAVDTSFKYWCDEYGCSSDSLSAFDTYRACCDIGEKMRRLFTGAEMETMREMLQDY